MVSFIAAQIGVDPDEHANWLANPFAYATLLSGQQAPKGAGLEWAAQTLGLKVDTLLGEQSPLRRNALTRASLDAGGHGTIKAAGALPTPSTSPLGLGRGPVVAVDPSLAPWSPPTVPGRATYRLLSADWRAFGPMLIGAPRFTDPRQGGVPNCNFVSSLSSVAFTTPTAITSAIRAARLASGEAAYMITLRRDGGELGGVLATDRVPVYRAMFGEPRGDEAGELPPPHEGEILPCMQNGWSQHAERGSYSMWPAIFEKAFAKNGLRVSHDQPNLMLPNYWGYAPGSDAGIHPLTVLTGFPTERYESSRMSAADLYGLIRSMCGSDGRMLVPAIIGASRPADVPVSEMMARGLVSEHAYSVLGTIEQGGARYIVLRNPWGQTNPTGTGTIAGAWNGAALGEDGLFALEDVLVSRYFRMQMYLARPESHSIARRVVPSGQIGSPPTQDTGGISRTAVGLLSFVAGIGVGAGALWLIKKPRSMPLTPGRSSQLTRW